MLFGLAAAAIVAYSGFIAAIYLMQRALIYKPNRACMGPGSCGLTKAEEVVLTTADGERLIAWHVAPRFARPVILYFHGRCGNLHEHSGRFTQLVEEGYGLFVFFYRGYGGSSGAPSEAGLLIDGAAAYTFCAGRYPTERIAVWGESLGTGVAVALASERRIGWLILEAPFTSVADIAQRRYPMIPVRVLMKDQFQSDARAGAIRAPTLVLHGALDRIVPIGLGERLFAGIRAPKRFVRFANGGHDGLDAHGAIPAVREFIDIGRRNISSRVE